MGAAAPTWDAAKTDQGKGTKLGDGSLQLSFDCVGAVDRSQAGAASTAGACMAVEAFVNRLVELAVGLTISI
jgi:hypothetical protein